MNYLERIDYKRSLCQMLCEFPADFFVTANFNKPELSHLAAKDKLKRFHAVLDRKLLGKHWACSPARTDFIAVSETKCGMRHYHMLVRIPDHSNHDRFTLLAPELFRTNRISVGGSLDIKPVLSAAGQNAIAEYMTKNCYQPESIENYVLSSEFVTSRCVRE
jgi:hypothetical protein